MHSCSLSFGQETTQAITNHISDLSIPATVTKHCVLALSWTLLLLCFSAFFAITRLCCCEKSEIARSLCSTFSLPDTPKTLVGPAHTLLTTQRRRLRIQRFHSCRLIEVGLYEKGQGQGNTVYAFVVAGLGQEVGGCAGRVRGQRAGCVQSGGGCGGQGACPGEGDGVGGQGCGCFVCQDGGWRRGQRGG